VNCELNRVKNRYTGLLSEKHKISAYLTRRIIGEAIIMHSIYHA